MAVRDRSQELYQLFDLYRVQAMNGAVAVDVPISTTTVCGGAREGTGRFNEFAQAFALEISSVAENIGRLTRLMQSQNVFDDHGQEISGLSGIVKGKLQQLHDDLEALIVLKEELSAPAATFFSTDHNSHSEKGSVKHCDTVVHTLRARLVKTSNLYRTALQERTAALKNSASRRSHFTSDRPSTFESALFSQQQQEVAVVNSNSLYFRQRQDAMREIEAAVQEVSVLFQDFTRLVHEQEESIVRIDADVDDSLRNVNAGTNEIMRYLASLSSNRGLILKIFAILFFFLLFFGFVVVR